MTTVYIDFGDGFIDVSSNVIYNTLTYTGNTYNENCTHQQSEASFSLSYAEYIYTGYINASILYVKIYKDGIVKFYGYAKPQLEYTYTGVQDNIIFDLNFSDLLSRLNTKIEEVALTDYYVLNSNDSEHSIVHYLCDLCGFDASYIDSTVNILDVVPYFVPEDDSEVLSVLDTLLFEYGYSLIQTDEGLFSVVQWAVETTSTSEITLDESDIEIELEVTSNVSDYDTIEITYYEAAVKDNVLVYAEDLPRDTDGTLTGYAVLASTYYPVKANVIDDTTGLLTVVEQAYETTGIEYLTNKAITNNLNYNYTAFDSDFSSMLITSNHRLEKKFDDGLTLVSSDFYNKKAHILYYNPTDSSLNLYASRIFATVAYRRTESTVAFNLIDNPTKQYSYSVQFCFDPDKIQVFGEALSRQYKSCLTFKFTSEVTWTRGTLINIVTDGTPTSLCQVTSSSWDEANAQYVIKCRVIAQTAIAVSKRTNTEASVIVNTSTASLSVDTTQLTVPSVGGSYNFDDAIITSTILLNGEEDDTSEWSFVYTPSGVTGTETTTGTYHVTGFSTSAASGSVSIVASKSGWESLSATCTIVGAVAYNVTSAPDLVSTLTAIAYEDGLTISCGALSSEARNAVAYYTLEISKDSGSTWTVYTMSSNPYTYLFNRSTDGYPETSDLAAWRVRVKVVNTSGITTTNYGPSNTGVSVDYATYKTWIPPAPVVTAVAQEKTLDCSWTIDTSAYYGTNKTFKLLIETTTKKSGITMQSYSYPWDRDVDGYPETVANEGTLDNLNIYIVAVTAENTTGTSSAVVHPDVSSYLTWLPSQPTLSGSCAGRKATLTPIVGNSTYGHQGFRFQIRRSDDGTNYYALGSSDDAYTDETSYRTGSVGGYTLEAIESMNSITQSLPLINQSASLPEDTEYYYRIYTVVAVPTTSSPSAVNVSTVSDTKLITAKATGVADVVAASITTAKLAQHAVTNEILGLLAVKDENIYGNTISMAKFAAGIRPPRVVSTLPVSPFTGYAAGDTVVLTTDSKLYRFTGTEFTKAVDGVDLVADSVTAGAIAAGAIGTSELAVGDGTNIFSYDLSSFENYASDYIPSFVGFGVSSYAVSTEKFYDGAKSLKIVTSSGVSEGYLYFASSETDYTHTVESEKYYILSCYVYALTACTAQIWAKTSDGTHHGSSYFSISANVWKRIYVKFQVPSGYTALLPRVDINAASTTVYFDAFQLESCEASDSEPSGYRSPGLTTIDGSLIKTRTIQANEALIEGSITADEIAANTIDTTNLSVVARNKINSFTDSSDGVTGWTIGTGYSFTTVSGYRTLTLTSPSTSGVSCISDEFAVLPDEICSFAFGLQCPNYSSGGGIYVGIGPLTRAYYTTYQYNFTTKKWVSVTQSGTYAYVIQNYISTTRKNYKTYILGSNVDISSIPAPLYTDSTYSLFCVKLSAGYTTASIRLAYGTVVTGTYWYLYLPQVYSVGTSTLTAENIVVEKLTSITSSLGTILGDDSTNYKLVMSPSSSETDPEGTLLLGATTDASYFRRYKSSGAWYLDIKTSTFKVDSVSSNIYGDFTVSTTGGVNRFLVDVDSYVGAYGVPLLVYAGAGTSYNNGIRVAYADNSSAGIYLGTSWSSSGWSSGQWGVIVNSTYFTISGPNSGNTASTDILIINRTGIATTLYGSLSIGSSLSTGGAASISGNITMSAGGIITGPYGVMIQSTDEWLRLNPSTGHSNGIYCGSGILRTDGEFQIGGAGAYVKITAAGAMTLASTITTGGNAYFGSSLLTHGKTSSTDGLPGEILGIGSIEISGATPYIDFHFGNSTADYTTRLIEDASGVLNLLGTLRPSYLGRKTYSSGCFVGGQDNIGATDTKVSPIYTIGSGYLPTDTSLENMYGIFYSYSSFWGANSITARTGWGLGIANAGTLNALITEGGIWTSGQIYGASLTITGAVTISSTLSVTGEITGDLSGHATTSGYGTVVAAALIAGVAGTFSKKKNIATSAKMSTGYFRLYFTDSVSTDSVFVCSSPGTSSTSMGLQVNATIYSTYVDIYCYSDSGLTDPVALQVAIIGDFA